MTADAIQIDTTAVAPLVAVPLLLLLLLGMLFKTRKHRRSHKDET